MLFRDDGLSEEEINFRNWVPFLLMVFAVIVMLIILFISGGFK